MLNMCFPVDVHPVNAKPSPNRIVLFILARQSCQVVNYLSESVIVYNACVCVFQGANASALEKEIGPEQFPVNEHYFGLVNVSDLLLRITE